MEQETTAGCLGTDTLVDYLEGRADRMLRMRIERHASRCASCREVLSSLARDGIPFVHGAGQAPRPEGAVGLGTRVGRSMIARQVSLTDPLPLVDPSCYEILSEHARGGLGRVMRARDRRTGRMVAIKEVEGSDAAIEARFAREARLTALLEHPAIVPVYEVGRWPSGRPFYAMKFVEGRSLATMISSATDTPDRLRLVPHVVAVAEAVAYAHSHGVVHRDLKPENVLVGSFGETVVVDWGLAKKHKTEETRTPERKLAASNGAFETRAGVIMGTPAYMSPEQARGEPTDERTDRSTKVAPRRRFSTTYARG
jgi:serine/threonine protein kinase